MNATFTFACTPTDMHPYNCDGPGRCVPLRPNTDAEAQPRPVRPMLEQPARQGDHMTFTTHDIALIAIAIALWVYVLFGANLTGT